MPAIRLFGRKWAFGSDDLFYPSLGELLLRILWLLIIVITVSIREVNAFNCESGQAFKTFFIGIISTLGVVILLSLALMIASSQGGIMDTHARRHVPLIFYLKLICYPVELAWVGFGFYWGFFDSTNCPHQVALTVCIVTVADLFFFCLNLIGAIVLFEPKFGGRSAGSSSTRSWERRCRLLCCTCTQRETEQQAFLSIARTLTNFFQEVDLVPSDIAAGMILLRESERRMGSTQRGRVSRHVINTETVDLSDRDIHRHVTGTSLDDDWLTTRRIVHFSQLAMACYGWPLFLFTNVGKCGVCQLCGSCGTCSCCMKPPENTFRPQEDNICECNMAAVLKITQLPPENFIYVTFHNELFATPFMVVLDDETGSVVVAVRGTLSMQDAVTDMVVEGEGLDAEEMPHFVVHCGMVRAARYIRSQLEDRHLLEQAFTRRPNYNLTICGHSLGAGVATILAVLLRKSYPDLRCYAYAPPQGLVNKSLSIHCQTFVCSVFLGYDIVPRLSLGTLEDLKDRLLTVLAESPDSKSRILARCATTTLCPLAVLPPSQRRLSRGTRPGQPLIRGGPPPRYRSHMDEENGDHQPPSGTFSGLNLTLAGRVLHVLQLEEEEIIEVTERMDSTDDGNIIGIWSGHDRFDSILIHPKMMTDHLPDKLHRALIQLHRQNCSPNNPMRRVRSVDS